MTTPAIPARLRFETLVAHGRRCAYCGRGVRDGARLEVDHVVARAAGGGNERQNLVPACQACNRGKGASPVPVPRWTRIAPRWDRCECPEPSGLVARDAELVCTDCGFAAYARVFEGLQPVGARLPARAG